MIHQIACVWQGAVRKLVHPHAFQAQSFFSEFRIPKFCAVNGDFWRCLSGWNLSYSFQHLVYFYRNGTEFCAFSRTIPDRIAICGFWAGALIGQRYYWGLRAMFCVPAKITWMKQTSDICLADISIAFSVQQINPVFVPTVEQQQCVCNEIKLNCYWTSTAGRLFHSENRCSSRQSEPVSLWKLSAWL